MLRRRFIGAAVLGTSLVLTSFALLHVHNAGPSQPAQLAVTTPADTPPPFPGDVVNGVAPSVGAVIRAGGPFDQPGRCTQESTHRSIAVDSIAKETTVAELAANTDEIVVADAVRQVAFWQKSNAQWQSMTMTEYHITSVIKGTIGPWLQVIDGGASSDLIATCKSQAYTIANQPVPTLNQRYVLFVKLDPARGTVVVDAMRRFPIVDGTVNTEAALHPAAKASVVWDFKPEPLDSFLAALQPGASSVP